MKNTADETGGKPIGVLLQSISGLNAINPLVAFYDIHGGEREMLFFYFVPDTTRDQNFYTSINKNINPIPIRDQSASILFQIKIKHNRSLNDSFEVTNIKTYNRIKNTKSGNLIIHK
jgi:hypothetical protein